MLKNVEISLNDFAKSVIRQSKANLKRLGKNASRRLSDSLGYDLKVHRQSFSLRMLMEDYGEFVDKGVKGVGGTKADGTTWKRKRVTNALYKYTTKRPPHTAFNGWTIRKGIAPRSAGGQFTTRRSLLYALATSVYHTGLETTNFFSKPFAKEFKKLPDELVDAFALDLQEFIKFTRE
jgi:hypothetical protein